MKSQLCSVLVVLLTAVLSATDLHADELDAVGAEETISETGEPASAGSDSLPATKAAWKTKRDQRVGTRLMISAFVVQGLSFGMTFASIFGGNSGVLAGSWVVQSITIPFAPMGVHGFALRFGGTNRSQRLHWTGVGLLQAAAFSGLVAGVGLAAVISPFNAHFDGFSPIYGGVPSGVAHFLASMTFVISGGVCVGSAREQAQRQGKSQSRRTPAKSSHRGFVVPTIAPRPGGVSLGLTGVF